MQPRIKALVRRGLRHVAELAAVDLLFFWLGFRTAALLMAAVLGIATFGGLIVAFVLGARQIRNDLRASTTRRAV